MKLEDLKGQKRMEFWEKPKISSKQGFLTFAKKLINSCFFFYPKNGS